MLHLPNYGTLLLTNRLNFQAEEEERKEREAEKRKEIEAKEAKKREAALGKAPAKKGGKKK